MNLLSATLFMLLFCFLLPLGDALVKVLMESGFSTSQILWTRSLMIISMLTPLLIKNDGFKVKRELSKLYLARNLFFFIAVSCWFFVLMKVPLPQMYAIGFTSPIFASILSTFFLNETLSKHKILSLIGGFIGVFCIINPSIEGLNPYLLIPVFCALNWAGAMLITKKLSHTESFAKLTFYLSLTFICLTTIPALQSWIWPTFNQWLILVAMAIIIIVTHMALINAYKRAELTVLAPLEFTTLIFSTMLSITLFNEMVNLSTFIGGTIIFLSASWQHLIQIPLIKIFYPKNS